MIHKGDYFAQFNEDLPEGYDILQVRDILGNSIEAEGITIGPSDLRVRQWSISREIGLRYWTPIAPEDAIVFIDFSILKKVLGCIGTRS